MLRPSIKKSLSAKDFFPEFDSPDVRGDLALVNDEQGASENPAQLRDWCITAIGWFQGIKANDLRRELLREVP